MRLPHTADHGLPYAHARTSRGSHTPHHRSCTQAHLQVVAEQHVDARTYCREVIGTQLKDRHKVGVALVHRSHIYDPRNTL